MPDTGPSLSPLIRRQAQQIFDIGGYRLCYTLALALQTIAEELSGVMEQERFLPPAEALELANALLQQVPEHWTGDVPEEPPPPAPDAVADQHRASAAVTRAQEASRPTPVFRELTQPKER